MTLIEELSKRNSLMTVEEVATLLNIHPITLYRWTYAGTIPVMKLGGRKNFDPKALIEWTRQRGMGS